MSIFCAIHATSLLCIIGASAIYSNYDYGSSGYASGQLYAHHSDPHLNALLNGHKPQLPPDVIKITKTVAVQVPRPIYVPHHIPYPVKVEVPRPYPYPYPVEVPKIVTVKEQIPVPVHTQTDYGHSAHTATAIQPTQFEHQDAYIAAAPAADGQLQSGHGESNVEHAVAYGDGSGYHS